MVAYLNIHQNWYIISSEVIVSHENIYQTLNHTVLC